MHSSRFESSSCVALLSVALTAVALPAFGSSSTATSPSTEHPRPTDAVPGSSLGSVLLHLVDSGGTQAVSAACPSSKPKKIFIWSRRNVRPFSVWRSSPYVLT